MPYLILVLLGGILHNRIWLKRIINNLAFRYLMIDNYICQIYVKCCYKCAKYTNVYRSSATYFITICLIVSILSLTPILNVLSQIFTPILSLLGISSELSPGILFSMIRKDGMLLFNLHQGALLQGMTATQLLLLVCF